MKTVNIKGKEYVEVNERLKYFRKNFTNYSLESDVIQLDNGVITIKAIIRDENGRIIATGLAQEKESSSFINKTSFVENCETSAWGRALGNLGIGIDTAVATAEEVQNAINNQSQKKFNPKPDSNDKELFDLLKGCENMEELAAVYKEYYKQVVDKDMFSQIKDEMKQKLGGNK